MSRKELTNEVMHERLKAKENCVSTYNIYKYIWCSALVLLHNYIITADIFPYIPQQILQLVLQLVLVVRCVQYAYSHI